MGRWLRTLSTKLKMGVLVSGLLVAQVAGAAAPFMSTKAFAANNGTLKVHEIGTPTGTENNDPKVCAFNFEGFGFDPGQTGQLQLTVQGNDAPHGTPAGPFAFGPTDGTGYAISQDFNNGPGTTTIQNGHYKVTLYGKDANGVYNVDLKAKSKVFKVNCSAQPVAPTITVTKVVNNNHGGTAQISDFPLLVSGVGGKSVTSGVTESFTAGQTYTVSEGVGPSGYTQTNLVCVDVANPQVAFGATFGVVADEDIDCTITNEDIAPTLTLNKMVNNTHGGTASAANFQAQVNGSNVAWGATNPETAGVTYTLSENALAGGAGYSAGNWSCNGGTLNGNQLTLAVGQNVTCTIINSDMAPKLTVIKNVVSNYGGTATPGNFTMNVNGTNVSNGSFPGSSQGTTVTLNAGNYSVSESGGPAGYTGSSSADCSGSVALGETKVCTITNTQNPASISGHKFEVNANGAQGSGGTPIQNWTVYLLVNGQPVAHTTTDASGTYSFTGLNWGNYTLAECQNVSDGCSTWTQIYGPSGVTLGANNLSSSDKDFGNFKNGSISGYKWNDLNGNGALNQGEPKLSGWTINLFQNNAFITSAVTDNNGNYSFTNVAPGTYSVCEAQQAGWVQIFPANNGCYTIVIDQSGETNPAANFGNQGRGTIKVVKNVDSDGDGIVDFQDVTNWNWNIDGSGNFTTGSANAQSVAAGTHSVSEVQKPNYHVTASSCSGELVPRNPTTSLGVTVSPGESVTCTFTNTRDTGIVEVTKNLVPSNDSGRFDLLIDGTVKATNVGDNGTTHDVKVLTGTHSVSEVAANASTSLADYDSSYVCFDGFFVVTFGNGTVTHNFNVPANHEINCYFTNVRHATITIVKDAQPDSSQSFDFTIKKFALGPNPVVKNFSLVDDGTNNGSSNSTGVSTGIYEVDETAVADWDLTNISCNAQVSKNLTKGTVTFLVLPGQHLTCTFTNVRQTGDITVSKVLFPNNDPGKFNLQVDGATAAANVGNGGTTGAVQVFTGTHSVSEIAGTGTNLSDYTSTYSCTNGLSGNGTFTANFTVNKGDSVNCTFTNQKKAAPQVLGASTTNTSHPQVLGAQLTDTGLPIVAYTLAAMSLIGAALFVTKYRKTARQL